MNITYCDADGTFLFSRHNDGIKPGLRQVGREYVYDPANASYHWARHMTNRLNGVDYDFYISESSIYLGKSLSGLSQVVLSTGARYSTVLSREHLMPFVTVAMIENGGLIFEKENGFWKKDMGWYEALSHERRILWEFNDMLSGKYGMVPDIAGRTTMIRYRQRDNVLRIDDIISEVVIPDELQLTYNLGHLDFIPKSSGKHNAKSYFESKYASVTSAAVGDDWNDAVLLSNVDYPILMGNAPDALKEIGEAGNWLIVGKNFNGIGQALRHLIARFG
ncbi:MAG: HAD hydrolase family protein [Candidatus Woesearchaeota archaeon]|nr:HAD hydrolase family protein [Candidatus Woesearchaeota archaeon]